MTRGYLLATLLAATTAIAGCGDSSKECGENTVLQGGVCVGAGGTVTCTNGTRLDEATNECVIDPASCQGGTVLINGACRDPNTEVTPDAIEGAEPNGLGLGGETSTVPAGEVTLEAPGAGSVIIKGNIAPRPDRDDDDQPEGDVDTYLFDVAGPTLLQVTADGVDGVAAGFFAVTDTPGLQSWIRFGVNLTGDTTKRQLFLPAAGTYALAIADTRTLTSGAAVGDANTAYFVTLEALAMPTPSTIALTAGTGTATGTIASGEAAFYAATLGTGLNEATLATFHPDFEGSLVVLTNDVFHATSDESKGVPSDVPANVIIGGVATGESTLLVVDQVINTTVAPVEFDLTVTSRTAAALAANGTAMQANVLAPGTFPTSLDDLAAFYFDVAAAGDTIGMDIAWTNPVDGILLDERGAIISELSWDGAFASFAGNFFDGWGTSTWAGYLGLFRAPAAGRYYFVVNDPAATAGADIVATTTLTTVTPTTQTFDTPITAVAPNLFDSVPYEYTGSTQAWQLFTIQADAAAGGATVTYYDAASALGRLDDLVLASQLGDPDTTVAGDPPPLLAATAPGGGSGQQGRIMIGTPQRLFAKVNTANGTGTFGVEATNQVYTDEMTVNAGAATMHTNQIIDLTTTRQLYLIRSTPRNTVTISVTPSVTLDAQIRIVGPNENVITTRNTGLAGAVESFGTTFPAAGWLAVEVSGAGVGLTGTFAISFTVAAPTYDLTAGATPWSNACTGGTDVTPLDRDDGVTGPITIPAFQLFTSQNLTSIRISTNGWLTFDATTTAISSVPTESSIPNASTPNGVIAPYWDDLTRVRICTKQSGTKVVVQWRGELYRSTEAAPQATIGVQAILDSSNNSVELVYAPYMEATGATGSGAAGGIENASGTQGVSVFFHTPSVVPGTSVKLTP